MNTLATLVFLVIIALFSVVESQSSPKLVVHVDDPANVEEAVANVNNWFKALNTSGDAIIVLNGIAVIILPVPGTVTDSLIALNTNYKVKIYACNNSLRGLNIDVKSLPSYVTVVPAAILSLQQLQAQGYAYVKP